MRKIIILVCILPLVLFTFTFNSSGKDVSKHSESGNLVMTYYDLKTELPVIGEITVDKAILNLDWTGKGNEVITLPNKHNRHIKFDNADGTITLIGVSPSTYEGIIIVIKIVSGTISEHDTGTVSPDTVDALFNAKSVEITIPAFPIIKLGQTVIKIQDGQLKFAKSKDLAAPNKNMTHITTFARLKKDNI